jgi:hypothetical protein
MYNEKNEVEKVNFGDLPIDWEDEEFAEELYEGQASNYKQQTQKSLSKPNRIIQQYEE